MRVNYDFQVALALLNDVPESNTLLIWAESYLNNFSMLTEESGKGLT